MTTKTAVAAFPSPAEVLDAICRLTVAEFAEVVAVITSRAESEAT